MIVIRGTEVGLPNSELEGGVQAGEKNTAEFNTKQEQFFMPISPRNVDKGASTKHKEQSTIR